MGSKRKRSAQQTVPSNAPPAKKQQTLSTLNIDLSPFLDDPKGVDRKRQADLYSLLGDEDAYQRLLAAEAYLTCLLGGAGVSEPTLNYHLNRLLGGLATSRKGSRIGYSLVLVEVLGQLFGGAGNLAAEKYNGVTFESVLEILIVRMRPDGDASGQETEHMLGLLFGLQSFVDAKILFNEDETCSRWILILEKLLELAKKKPWIREACGKVIVKALEQMPRQAQVELTLNIIYDAGLALTSEGVGIWITAKQRFPNMKTKSKPWGNNADPLQNLRLLAMAMKESPDKEAKADKIQPAIQTGSWNPQLHFVWTILLNVLVNPAKNENQDTQDEFKTFWKVVVDENLFGTNASRERKYWGFLLFQKVLQDAKIFGNLVECIFSHNLVRCLINSVKDEERFLYHAAKKTLEALEQAVEAYRSLLPIILPHLIGGYGKYNFDGLTKTKTVDKLLSLTTVDTSDSTLSQVMSVLLKPVVIIEGSEAVQEAESRRQTFGDYLHSLLNLIRRSDRATPLENHAWVKTHVLPTLADFAYGTKIARENKTFQPPVTEKTRNLFRDRLMSAFTPLLTDLNGYHYPCDLLVEITCREQNALPADLVSEFRSHPRHATIEDNGFNEDDGWNVVQMDGQVSKAKNKAAITMMKILNNISTQKTENRNITARLQALSILYALILFQLYNGDPEAVSVLDELKLCYNGLVGRKATETSKSESSEVLVELLLSFISKPSVLLRKVSNLVFTAFVDEMTEGCLTLMTDVLGSSESLKGQQELFDQEPENEDEMDVDGNEEELDSDVEVIDGDGANSKVHDDELDSDVEIINGEDLDDADDDGNEDDEENKKLDEALAKALGTRKLNPEGGEDEESESDADMSDSEMMALDSKLVEIFSQRKKEPSKKKEKKEAKETMVNFKSRVLDLLEIYVKKQPTNPLACELLLPLLNLIRSTNTPELTQKASKVISLFAKAAKKARKGKSQADASVKEQIKLMKSIHTEATKSTSHALAKAASTASLLIASSLLRADKKNFKKISKVYVESQSEIEAGRAYMQPSFMDEWNNWVQSQASNISAN